MVREYILNKLYGLSKLTVISNSTIHLTAHPELQELWYVENESETEDRTYVDQGRPPSGDLFIKVNKKGKYC